jgi:hypothetical protein
VWRPRLEPLLDLTRLRIVNCVADPDLALRRIWQRARDNPLRRAHADPGPERPPGPERAFTRISLDVPSLEVDTADGYRPGLDQIVAFVNG